LIFSYYWFTTLQKKMVYELWSAEYHLGCSFSTNRGGRLDRR
jgi:hypothetical protein